MSASGGNARVLANALHDLLQHWDQTGGAWRDRARVDFEKDYLQELLPTVRRASEAVQQIEDLLRQVRKECA